MQVTPRSAYIHIPFCLSKCHYCDFSSFPGMDSLFDAYVHALISEVNSVLSPSPLHPELHAEPVEARGEGGLQTVYFGGGTPTILTVSQLADILNAIRDRLGISSDAEITIEANPGTVDEAKFAQLFSTGFNRLSLGVQSFDDEFLRTVGRVHTSKQALDAYYSARRAGFRNVGIDLIFALPGQSLNHWSTTLDTVVDLHPEHISLYELSIEEGTQFARLCAQGVLDQVDEDTRLAMYELAIARLTSAGYEHYEVSNFAHPGFRSRHNQVYWRNEPYYAFGGGATSFVDGVRAHRVAVPQAYIDAIGSSSDPIDEFEKLSGRQAMAETIMLGLRMLDGVDMHKISTETCTNALVEFALEIESLTRRGLVELAGSRLLATHKGLLLLNDVVQEFM